MFMYIYFPHTLFNIYITFYCILVEHVYFVLQYIYLAFIFYVPYSFEYLFCINF